MSLLLANQRTRYDVYYYYDNLNRQYAIERYPGGYDQFTGWDANGNVSDVWTNAGQVNYVYDQATNRLIETWTGTGSKSSATSDTLYGYDAQGRLASVTVVKQDGAVPEATSNTISYFDADGNTITPTYSYPTTLYAYDADGNITSVTYPNGTTTSTNYTGLWTPTGGMSPVFGGETITNSRGGTTLSSFVYSFDADRRKISDLEMMTDAGETATSAALYTWTYDNLSRLTSERYDYGNDDTPTSGHTTDDYTDNYTYDLDGNRITKSHDISSDGTIDQKIYDSYNANNELLAETDNASYNTKYVYDANGSPTSVTTVTGGTTTTNSYTYDPQNQMITAVIGGVTTSYMYSVDNDGRIVSEQTGTTITTYVWDVNNPTGYSQVLETWTGGSTLASSFIIGDRVLGQDVIKSGTGAVSYILPDGEDNTRQLTLYSPVSNSSLNGKVRARYDYDGFGNLLKYTATTHTANYLTTSVLFKGSYVDPATGNDIMGVREYNQLTDRFWTQDSENFQPGDWDNSNLYMFAGGDPLDQSDPTGHLTALETLTSVGEDALNLVNYIREGMQVRNEVQNLVNIGSAIYDMFYGNMLSALRDAMQDALTDPRYAYHGLTLRIGLNDVESALTQTIDDLPTIVRRMSDVPAVWEPLIDAVKNPENYRLIIFAPTILGLPYGGEELGKVKIPGLSLGGMKVSVSFALGGGRLFGIGLLKNGDDEGTQILRVDYHEINRRQPRFVHDARNVQDINLPSGLVFHWQVPENEPSARVVWQY